MVFRGYPSAAVGAFSHRDTVGCEPRPRPVSGRRAQASAGELKPGAVDGKQVGGTYTATALLSAGQSQAISVDTVLGNGTLTVGISFINDAWGGTF